MSGCGLPLAYPVPREAVPPLVRDSLFLPRRSCSKTRLDINGMDATLWLRPGQELLPESPAAMAIGAFDGLHVGHRRLVARTCAFAREKGCIPLAVTFDPDPALLFNPAQVGQGLLSTENRVAGLLSLGLDGVVVLHFDRRLAAMAPESFVDQVLYSIARPACVCVGSNFNFGAGGAGGVETLRACGEVRGFEVVAEDLVRMDGSTVSATRIRGLLHAGKVGDASRLLARLHFARGQVEHGRGEGHVLGFPTANVRVSEHACLPAQGVYACLACDGRRAWPAATNVGAPPSFSGDDPAFLEANLIGFDGNLYGEDLSILFCSFLRSSRVFSSVEELEKTVLGNIGWVRGNIGTGGWEVLG